MQIETNHLIYILFVLLGVGWRFFVGWMKTVNSKLEDLRDQKMVCMQDFVSRKEFEQSKDHVWQKLREHDQMFRELRSGR